MLDGQITSGDAHDAAQARSRILELETAMRAEIGAGALVETTAQCALEHMFIPGAYARQVTIPAGTLAVGKIHRYPCFNVLLSGEIAVMTESGKKTMAAPAFFRSEAGVKRVGLALTDTVWITIHPTQETELDRLEAELICESYDNLLGTENTKCLG